MNFAFYLNIDFTKDNEMFKKFAERSKRVLKFRKLINQYFL